MSSINIDAELDGAARALALDCTKSYIVQAPAGSGKTELLTQRVLNLLNYVDKPEEIVALTFTRKAAEEMRARIIFALTNVDESVDQTAVKGHQLITSNLAKAAIAKNKTLQWNLLSNPARLNITTIDSLCASIVKRMPILSQIGGNVNITEDPKTFYVQAIKEVFKLVNTDNIDNKVNNNWEHDFTVLLKHFGCNYNKLQNFLLEMIYKREQWLPYVVNVRSDNIHDLMQFCWQELSCDVIKLVSDYIPLNMQTELSGLLEFASLQLLKSAELNNVQQILINHNKNTLSYWQAISYLLLSADDSNPDFRKRVDKRLGFPSKADASSKEEQELYINKKAQLLNIISDLSASDSINEGLISAFCLLRVLPAFDYSKENWELLKILANVLVLLEAQLRIILKNNKVTDFSGITQGALYALGSRDHISDLSLWFDYNIKHILIDEFQDTSYSQYQLLAKLTATWDQNDLGYKTLFLVGDPMQSIYRFRQAEVGLFLQVKQYGIGNVKLHFLKLIKNFRSSKQVVAWVNNKFNQILPKKSNQLFGAISYSNAIATQEDTSDPSPTVYLHAKNNNAENKFIIEQVLKIIANNANFANTVTIAILVRNRTKVGALVSDLKKHNLIINAVDIELLSDKMVIKDLLSLTMAVLDLSNRTAWYSILRAPWCGLSLSDLYKLNFGNEDKVIYQVLLEDNSLDHDALNKVSNLLLAFKYIFNNLYKIKFYKIIKQSWYVLGGHLIYNNTQDLADAEQFFNLLFTLEKSNYISNQEQLIEQVNKLYSNCNINHNSKITLNYQLDIMTIHKSKGLEFDYVILPYLDQGSKGNDHQMLLWQQYHNNNINGILMAPYYFNDNDQVKFYNSLRYIEQQKESFELARLLYVAVTRAKHGCILTASIDFDKLNLDGNLNSDSAFDISKIKTNINSMLMKLLYYLELSECVFIKGEHNLSSGITVAAGNYLKYIEPSSYNFKYLVNLPNYSYLKTKTKDLLFDEPRNDNPKHYLANASSVETLRIVGIFVHKLFYNIVNKYLDINNIFDKYNDIDTNFIALWRNCLLSYGVSMANINTALEHVTCAIKNILTDPVGLWILADYETSLAEQEFYYYINHKLHKSIIDRLFIDNNAIWIIDYKVVNNSEAEHANILLYKKQLDNYASLAGKYLLNANKNYNIKTGLYFPLTKHFISWDYSANS